ncbi:hypothetical protein SAMD00019534_034810 [Acytostelium subglobosum LB1]|uniref:hypothetical protein n=1 Tax=Acytostelium subglobosum LB1 TaxID=1410327 RepID=UPI000644D428|nr:hypothetical protein SAMD00019534_034810 [Acytostelium subglobosum LB1]GAM20306.1 hypothetical protein SAMD00019534_034810 [Acytostelium subglobosum LB1]|eukprot:XP_012759827.1 hypothetical protein SAMD00019534_034810 [Acytostelium subglobosum LB1]
MGKSKKSNTPPVEEVEELPEDVKKQLENASPDLSIEDIDEDNESVSRTSVMASFIKKLSFGADLSVMPVPASFILPKSTLSYFAEHYSNHFDILLQANEITDPTERFLQVAKYMMTTCLLPEDPTRKPLNPVLGETWEATVHYGATETENGQDDTTTSNSGAYCHFFAEQISHHPPISCTSVYNKEAGLYVSYYYPVRTNFMGTYAKLTFEGKVSVRLEKFNEEYTADCPNMAIRIFRSFSEFVGNTKMTVSSSKLRMKTVWHAKALLFGSYNQIESTVYNGKEKTHKIKGAWDQELKITEYKKDDYKTFMNRSTMIKGKMTLPKEVLPTDSSKVWGTLFDAFEKKAPMKEISKEKVRVEEEQRKLAASRKASKTIWKPVWFKQNDEGAWVQNNYK